MPVLFLTSCGIYPFVESEHSDTPTKSYYPPTGKKHLINATAALLLEALRAGCRTVVQVDPKKQSSLETLLKLHPRYDLITLLPVAIDSPLFTSLFFSTMQKLANETGAISRIDYCLYNSYSQGNADPFIPIFEENADTVTDIAASQINFFRRVGNTALSLLANHDQRELRFIAVTSLASRRMLAHLYSDAVHKTMATLYLQGFAYEAPHYTNRKNVSVIELMPGMVDTGTYDARRTRKMIMAAREMDGFAFDKSVSHETIDNWPMMPPSDLGKVAAWYLWRDQFSEAEKQKLDAYTCAGCPVKKLKKRMEQSVQIHKHGVRINRKAPDFCYCTGVSLGTLPNPKRGYIPVPLSPRGQYF